MLYTTTGRRLRVCDAIGSVYSSALVLELASPFPLSDGGARCISSLQVGISCLLDKQLAHVSFGFFLSHSHAVLRMWALYGTRRDLILSPCV